MCMNVLENMQNMQNANMQIYHVKYAKYAGMPSIQICQKYKFAKYANWNYEKYKNAIKAKNMQTIHLCKTKTGIFWILSKPRRK